jgi:CheY-like chemotaxis protein
MTAHVLAGEREKCLSYGMNEYISKPIREMQLLSLIGQFTNGNL